MVADFEPNRNPPELARLEILYGVLMYYVNASRRR
jgi:hypothetical protein